MKVFKTLLVVFVFTILTASKCRRHNLAPIDQLPPETQTGANTFGCLINGKAFLPKGDPFGGPIKKAQYQFVNGKQGFGVSARRREDESSELVGIIGDSIKLFVGTFDLASKMPGRFSAGYNYTDYNNFPGIEYITNEINRGQLVITKFDTINQIVSGTFWFDAKSSAGQIVEVRNGRFDMGYVR